MFHAIGLISLSEIIVSILLSIAIREYDPTRWFGGTFISPIWANTQFGSLCRVSNTGTAPFSSI